MQYWLSRAGCAPESLGRRAADLSLGRAPGLLCLKSQYTLLVPLSTLYFSLLNQRLLMIKIIKGMHYFPDLLIHWFICSGQLPCQFCCKRKKGMMKKTFIWLSSLLHLYAVRVKLIKNVTRSANGSKFWGPYWLQNLGPMRVFGLLRLSRAMVQSYKMCSNPAETHRKQQRQGIPGTHTP